MESLSGWLFSNAVGVQAGTAGGQESRVKGCRTVDCQLHALWGAQPPAAALLSPRSCIRACSTPAQVLPIEGQNDGSVDSLLISTAEFEGWVERHRAALARLAAGGGTEAVQLVAESNEAMQGSYAMLDATGRCGGCGGCGGAELSAAAPLLCCSSWAGTRAWVPPHLPIALPASTALLRKPAPRRFFSNATGAHVYGEPIVSAAHPEGSVAAAWASVSGFDSGKFAARGGVYDWGQGGERLEEQLGRWKPPGAGGRS